VTGSIALEGCLNFRDLGGYETRAGTVIRSGCVFRAGELCSLSDRDLETFAGLGIAAVLDLRNEHERRARPARLPAGVVVTERRSPSPAGAPGATLEEQIATGTVPEADDDLVASMNVALLERLAPEHRILLEAAVDAPQRPIVFHCVAGKDRTGVAAAVLLGVLGVPDETICADYELSNTGFAAPRLRALQPLVDEHAVDGDALRRLLSVRGHNLQLALDHVRERWGDFDGYATEVLGVDADLPERLRAALTC
jgi:protein-tyrosine phosphatase